MLAHLDLVPRIDVELILQYFDHLDLDENGRLSMDELLQEHHKVQAEQAVTGPEDEAAPLAGGISVPITPV